MQPKSFLFALAIATLMLTGCNGQEDFSGANIGGPIIDGTPKPDPNFDPSNPCSSRVVGNFINKGNVDNIGYICGGYLNYTGQVGIQDLERDQQRFVCPLFSNSVTFFIGGNDAREPLGTAYFRRASSRNLDDEGNNICQYDSATNEFIGGSVYDADGPYLFTVADIFDGPARTDVITDAAEDEQVAQNISALITGLDANTADDIEAIDYEAHKLVFTGATSFSDDFFDQPFADFVSATGEAQEFLNDVSTEGGFVGTLPANVLDVESSLDFANESTAAGIYRFDLLQPDYLLSYVFEQALNLPPEDQIYYSQALLSDLLFTRLQSSDMSTNPSDSKPDLVPFIFEADFLPFAMIDRQGRILGGGAFDVGQITLGNAGGVSRLCDDQPLYLALDGAAQITSDLTLNNVNFEPIGDAGSMSVPGRFIDGVAYSGLKVDVEGSSTDYESAYDTPGHAFDATKDRTTIETNGLCGSTINDQIVLGVRRQGLVMPKLDTALMAHFFATPAQYTVNYLARADAADEFPNQTTAATGAVTIHQDGTIVTDLNSDGNAALDTSNPSASGEYVIGMVSSVVPGVENGGTVEEEYFTQSEINIVIFNFGPKNLSSTLTRYGSHFRARLVPDLACAGNNSLFLAGDDTLSEHAFWFDTYSITNWLRNTTSPTPEDQYAALRTLAYGYVEGIQAGCTP